MTTNERETVKNMGLELIEIYESSRLSDHKVYQINGVLYRFLYKCPHSRSDHPKWCFKPMPGQRKSSILKLNENKVRLGIQEVPGMASTRSEAATISAIQQSLF
jgi:hypothetical protein